MSAKVSLTPLQWIAAGGALGIALLGGAGLFVLSGKLGDAQAALEQQSSEYKGLVGRRTFPNEQNIATLKANNEAVKQAVAVAEKRLRGDDSELAKITEQDPIAFKEVIAAQVEKIRQAAAKGGVKIEPAANEFAFAAYKSGKPSGAPATKVLAKQLFAIREISTALIDSHIAAITAVRRTMDEDKPGNPSTLGSSSPEALHGVITPSDDHLYTVYPVEFEFTGTERSLRDALAALSQNGAIFVPRYLTVSSLRATAPALNQLETDSQQTNDKGKRRTFIVAMGGEMVHVRLRVDLIDWDGGAAPKKK
ncbi:hypothetical protein SAMN05444156_1972 [Verrucomicrobium sp. GAS474]|uniref:Amuc_1100 family pilus-like protein n=1 Tax=Verrucomicrobium sp. GAS474 TaxID=1882831 RepID=UPI00087DB8F5|nr:Amuc_1100 family pilus-like protein [Verrucomicrobium sp. GAS474]SDU10332.1 hypothetical protein SAMN05444156_1972 [Verrucomicrobium sp. GAS474]